MVLRPLCCVLDLRTAGDFGTWHLPGSVNIPLHSLDSHTAKPFSDADVLEAQWLELEALFSNADVLGKLSGHNVLMLCYHGDTARVASSVLRAKGIAADSLRGGYQALKDHLLWGSNGVESNKMGKAASATVEAVDAAAEDAVVAAVETAVVVTDPR